MSDIFYDYAKYYDLLYQDKDFAAETAYVHGLIQQYRSGARTILDLGCGTGRHDACFVKSGYCVTGIDLSQEMLYQAQQWVAPGRLEFSRGDIRRVDLGRKFDAVVSLFHVMSYQVEDADINAALGTAAHHLETGGILIFDFWHGGGVLQDPPEVRVKRLEDDDVEIVRIAEPVLWTDRHLVEVCYQIISLKKKGCQYSQLREIHRMRYFFPAEISEALRRSGFSVVKLGKWMSDDVIDSAWYGVVVAIKN